MEGDQNYEHKKFVCKFCSRRFQCGKSLGGHIRTHLNKTKPIATTRRETEHDELVAAIVEEEEDDDDEFARVVTRTANLLTLDTGLDGQQPSYRLRENPKKSWRFSADHNKGVVVVPASSELHPQQQQHVCKECGKGFMSLKALCGHMACHSGEKERNKKKQQLVEIVEEFSEHNKVVMDSQSDTETSSAAAAKQQRRLSKRLRRESSSNFEVVHGGGSSSGSGVEQEQQEVAISLMMLSRDSGYKGGLNTFGESSDNNSVILEGKSSSIDMKIGTNRGISYGAKVSDAMEFKRVRESKLKYEEVSESDDSDSGYYIHDEPKKVGSDVSVDGFARNGEFEKLNAEFGVKESPKEETYELVGRSTSKYALRKTVKNVLHRPFISGSSGVEVYKNVKKSSKYECLTCKKTFNSHRALGGHRASHTKSYGYSESPVATPQSKLAVENKSNKGLTLINNDLGAKKGSGSKRSKGHECPFCFKIFKSGQAFGGHKRSHFVGGCEVKTLVLGQEQQQEHEEENDDEEEEEEEEDEDELEVPEDNADNPTLFDLNLPAPMEEETTGRYEYMSW